MARVVIADWSSGPAQDGLADLGGFRADVVAVVESIDPATNVVTRREGFFEPRGWHEAIAKTPFVDTLPDVLDRRFSAQLIIDLDHGWGSYNASVSDPCAANANDWDHTNKTTRVVDARDPRGRTGLLAQIAAVFDVPGGQYATCIPLGPTLAAADGSKIPAGFVVGVPAPASGTGSGTQDASSSTQGRAALGTAKFSTCLYVDPTATGQGSEGTPSSRLGILTTAYFGDTVNGRYGPLDFDGSTDASGLSAGSGTETKGRMLYDSAAKTWVPCLKASGGGGGGGGGGGFYGDGVDGAITIGTANVTSPFNAGNLIWGAHNAAGLTVDTSTNGPGAPSGNTLVACAHLTRDIFCTTLNVPATVTISGTSYPLVLVPGPFKIRATVSVTVDGRVSNSGWAWPGGQSPGGIYTISPNCLGDSTNFGGGQPGSGIALYPQFQGPSPANTAAGNGGGSTGSSGGGYSSPPSILRTVQEWSARSCHPSSIQGGGGGGQGRFSSGSDAGGVGGSGGLAVFVASPTIAGSGSITSDGEKGGSYAAGPPTAPTAYGGGGGNSGPILLIGETITVATSSTPGAAGVGTTANGTAGNGAGFVAKYKPSTDTYS